MIQLVLMNIHSAGLGTEVFMTPQPNSAKTGAQQFDEMYNNLRNSNINVRAVWIQVTSPINWSLVTTNNVNFLNSILSRARQYGITVGIYTNYYDWSQITNGAMVSNVMLWYWNVYGGGPQNETPADFSDFRQFGGWTVPSVKQFAQVESVCGVTVNRNVYTTSSAPKGMATMAKSAKSDEITVGGLLFENAAIMYHLAMLGALSVSCFASPAAQQEILQQAKPSKLNTLAYALDLSVQATPSDMSCFQRSLYNVIFVRLALPYGIMKSLSPRKNTVNSSSTSFVLTVHIAEATPLSVPEQSIHSQPSIFGTPTAVLYYMKYLTDTHSAGIGTEVYMTPQPSSAKTGAQQFDEMYNNLKNSNINVQTVWIQQKRSVRWFQVTSPINWSSVSTTNINFLNSILARASQYGLTVGIYTSYYDWSQITGGAVITNAMLWYWNVYGVGPYDESPADFSDFRAFGGWLSAAVKQFGQNENVCGVNVNRNVYLTSSAMSGMAKSEKSDEIVVDMLKIVALATCLVMNCNASPILEPMKIDQDDASELASIAYAVDLSVLASTATYQCMKQSLYNVAFIRGYTGAYQGQIDPYSVMNIQNAAAAGLGTEVYMTPQPLSSKTGAQQFDEMYNMLIGANIYVKSIWVQVTSPNNWSTSSSMNVNFLNSILAEALASTASAFDLAYSASVSTFQCFKQLKYNVAFIRAYTGDFQGQIDPYSVTNIQNAAATGLGTEVYMTPQPTSSKTGAQQFDEMYNMLIGGNIYIKSIWVQVVSPDDWTSSSTTNINFLNSILTRAMQLGLTVGVYTSKHEWNQITDHATTLNVRLWYWKTNGSGEADESPANFKDFKEFGSWTTPTVKQYGQFETICGLIVNRDIYSTSSAVAGDMAREETSDRIVVGGLGLEDLAVTAPSTISTSTFKCLKENHYDVVFIRGYTGSYQGQVDPFSVLNIQNATAAGLGIEVYMTPQPASASKTGAQQFDEMYEKLQDANISLRTIWVQGMLQVTSREDWSDSSTTNVNFLNSIFERALEHNISIGIYTNSEDWDKITDSASTRNVKLWYWSARGSGAVNESAPNFDDFQPFASWTSPSVKQFAKFETICGVIVNRNIYKTFPAGSTGQDTSKPIVVGGVGLGGAHFTGRAEIVP
ncbi:unnamed protein product [Haemonchus placei]|uniref:GHL10 domain-containing protein n=1 Tax=Haemonchus placei TaxID=6290 RepID=A0A158QNT0_HAEPC|nr:unnamed protein product [Haemonchus placei]